MIVNIQPSVGLSIDFYRITALLRAHLRNPASHPHRPRLGGPHSDAGDPKSSIDHLVNSAAASIFFPEALKKRTR